VLDPEERGELTDARVIDVVGGHLDDLVLVGCVLEGVRLTAASARRIHLTDVVLRDCELSGLDLQEARLRRVRLEGCRATALEAGGSQASDVVVVGSKLAEAGLRMTRWERAELDDVDLRGSDWTGASLQDVSVSGCDLSGSVLTKASMDDVRLGSTTLHDVVGARWLGGATIDPSQLVPVALALFADLGITLEDRDDPEA
jgi:uncharacterized protein YjbI with pentapeptide repeats